MKSETGPASDSACSQATKWVLRALYPPHLAALEPCTSLWLDASAAPTGDREGALRGGPVHPRPAPRISQISLLWIYSLHVPVAHLLV